MKQRGRLVLIILVAVISIALIVWALSNIGRTRGKTTRGTSADRYDTGPITDPPAPALTVRLLDVGQGDATYIHNGDSRVIIDGGPDAGRFGALLDSLGLNNTTIDVVVLTHQHYDHYNGLMALFDSKRHITVRYVFENKDAATATTLARLRDSIVARAQRDGLIYRDTDDPCANGTAACTITMRGGAKLHIMRPLPPPEKANNRSVAIALYGADSSAFSMWLAGDAEHDEIAYFESQGDLRPGSHVDVLKADHHGSCNGVTERYLTLLHPSWVVASLGAQNEYGHMHEQAKQVYSAAHVPWYRTDQNGTITIRSPGTPGGKYSIAVGRGTQNMNGPSDRTSHQQECAAME